MGGRPNFQEKGKRRGTPSSVRPSRTRWEIKPIMSELIIICGFTKPELNRRGMSQ
jgi:hypothetical protein